MKPFALVIFFGLTISFTSNAETKNSPIPNPKAPVCTRALHLEPTVRVREHRGGLEESLETEVTIDRTMQSLATYISRVMFETVTVRDIEVKPYGFDERTGWDTNPILVNGFPFGFTDGFIPVPKELKN